MRTTSFPSSGYAGCVTARSRAALALPYIRRPGCIFSAAALRRASHGLAGTARTGGIIDVRGPAKDNSPVMLFTAAGGRPKPQSTQTEAAADASAHLWEPGGRGGASRSEGWGGQGTTTTTITTLLLGSLSRGLAWLRRCSFVCLQVEVSQLMRGGRGQ